MRFGWHGLPIGPKVVPFWGSYLEPYKVIPKRSYYGAYGVSWRILAVTLDSRARGFGASQSSAERPS